MKRFLLTLTLVLFIAPFAMAQDLHSYIPTDGLVAYYPFNGNVNDTSGNNYNLVNNNVTYDSDRFGTDDSSAAYFSGNASELYLEESISQLTSDPRQTFTFWFKSITPSNRYIFEYASQSNARFRFVTSPTGGIGIRGETGCNSGGRDYVIPNLHEGWHHFVIAIDTQTYTVYYDGKVLYNASHSGFDCTDNVNKLNLGNDIGGGAKEYTNMLMDDIGIWNRVLSEQEIQNLYTSSNGDILLNGTVSAENNQIKNVADPTHSQDVTTKKYVDSKTSEISNSQNISNNSQIGLTGVVYDFEGNKYNTVVMCDGKQWTTQYLNVSFFANGDPIPEVVGNDAWRDLTTPAWCYPFNDDSGIGKLYNGFALTDARGLAPEGWHIATEDDWNNLIECLGGADVAGGKIKLSGTEYWAAPNVGSGPSGKASNSSGMSLTPAASREGANGNFYFQNSVGFWNYSTIDGRRPFVELIGDQAKINQGLTDPYDGSYILIVKD
jgi:uncharacterized protein (TIGR02145 family)